jgi:hypothetical protein
MNIKWRLLSSVEVNEDSIEEASPSGSWDADITLTKRYMETISIEAWALDGVDILSDLKQSKFRADVRKLLGDEGVTLIRSGSTTDLTEVLDTKWVNRFHADFDFYVWRSTARTQTDWLVNRVVLTGKLTNDAGADEVVTVDVTKP